ncbi:hypothetical protein WUBG_06153, partial [Wuchereria bancrofti]
RNLLLISDDDDDDDNDSDDDNDDDEDEGDKNGEGGHFDIVFMTTLTAKCDERSRNYAFSNCPLDINPVTRCF